MLTIHTSQARSEEKRKRARTAIGHVAQKERRRERINEKGYDRMPADPLEHVFDENHDDTDDADE